MITKLYNDDNVLVLDHNDLCEVARNYFDELLKEQMGVYALVIDTVNAHVSVVDNDMFIALFC